MSWTLLEQCCGVCAYMCSVFNLHIVAPDIQCADGDYDRVCASVSAEAVVSPESTAKRENE